MALPPEPIDEVLPLADACMIAKVTQIISSGKQSFIPDTSKDPEIVEVPRDLPEQYVELEVKELLFGKMYKVGQKLQIQKPSGDYVLKINLEAPFLIHHAEGAKHPEILGRYGPDTWSLRVLKAAIAHHKKS